jgi:tetratricopeptide (TPR) repeat protein
MRIAPAMMLELWLITAGAQASTPEQTLDEYVASGDKTLLERASSSIQTMPAEFRSRLLSARVLMLSGHLKEALAAAVNLNRDMPDELDAYGLIVEIALSLGDVKQAEAAGQWMLNLRPDDGRSLLAGAAVREAIEDYVGAEEMLLAALARTQRSEVAKRAAIGVVLARLKLRQGKPADAVTVLDQVDKAVPNYRPAVLLRKELR